MPGTDETDFASDIPLQLARDAHRWNSMTPERRGDQELAGYAQTLAGDLASLSALADTSEQRATLATEFARYREGYRTRKLAQLHALSRCASSFVTGPSNFPARRMEKRNATEAKRLGELVEYRERALAAIAKVLRPGDRPIMSGDSDAVERLRADVALAQAEQDKMKAANAAIRKHVKRGKLCQCGGALPCLDAMCEVGYAATSAAVAALAEIGHSRGVALQMLKPDELGRVGFPDYMITNNKANIRRMQARLDGLVRTKAEPDTSTEGSVARLEISPSDNRVRLYFGGKPDAATRELLKGRGFRWTPSLECWQAYRNAGSIELARKVAGME